MSDHVLQGCSPAPKVSWLGMVEQTKPVDLLALETLQRIEALMQQLVDHMRPPQQHVDPVKVPKDRAEKDIEQHHNQVQQKQGRPR